MDTIPDERVRFIQAVPQKSMTPLRKDHERSLRFLQDQHREVLMKLHGEIEILKAENKGCHPSLPFK
jgi:hypothetical protein